MKGHNTGQRSVDASYDGRVVHNYGQAGVILSRYSEAASSGPTRSGEPQRRSGDIKIGIAVCDIASRLILTVLIVGRHTCEVKFSCTSSQSTQ